MPARKPVSPERMLDAAMALAAERRWRDVGMADIAAHAKTDLASLYSVYPAKSSFLAALARKADDAMLAGAGRTDTAEPARDRLMDVILRRLDALKPYRKAVASVARDGGGGPFAAACSGARLLRSMCWALEAAGIGAAGVQGALRMKGLATVYLATLAVWLRDDSPDLGRTMAALDRNLRRAESLCTAISRPGFFHRPEAARADRSAK